MTLSNDIVLRVARRSESKVFLCPAEYLDTKTALRNTVDKFKMDLLVLSMIWKYRQLNQNVSLRNNNNYNNNNNNNNNIIIMGDKLLPYLGAKFQR